MALTAATLLPYLTRVAANGIAGAASTDPALAKGLSTLGGHLVHGPVARAHGLPYRNPIELLPAA
jgi:alanine dehydrogenase